MFFVNLYYIGHCFVQNRFLTNQKPTLCTLFVDICLWFEVSAAEC